MAWQEEMVPIVRGLLGDTAASPTYSNDRLEDAIIYAAQLNVENIPFDTTYSITVKTSTISPDPTTPSRDNAFINLCVLKAAWMVAVNELRAASRKTLIIRDGPSMIDASKSSAASKELVDELSKAFKRAVLEFRAGNSKAGEAIVGPYRWYEGDQGRREVPENVSIF